MAKQANKNATQHGPRTVASNRKARHDYHIEETFDAGIVLTGTEIKSVRSGHVTLRDGFVLIRNGEAWLMNVHIAQYEHGNIHNHPEVRQRKLLLHKREINRIHSEATQRSWTIVPLRMYIDAKGLAKVEIAVARGKQNYDKRAAISKRESDRDLRRALKQAF